MGPIAIQSQCCLQEKDDWETDEEEGGAPEEKVQLVEVPWHRRAGGGPLARLAAHRPRCPGVSRRRPLSPASPVQMHVNVTMRV